MRRLCLVNLEWFIGHHACSFEIIADRGLQICLIDLYLLLLLVSVEGRISVVALVVGEVIVVVRLCILGILELQQLLLLLDAVLTAEALIVSILLSQVRV